jgi:hypothetical protein
MSGFETKTAAGLLHMDKVANPIKYNKHRKRKNNDVVAAMYAMYQAGKSLEEIGAVYKRTRQSVYTLFKTREYELRSKQFRGLQVLDGIRFTLTKGGYLRGTFNGKRMLMHHYVWLKHTGQKIEKGWNIHHKDENKENNSFENLELLTVSEHTKKYSPHLNQFTSPTGSRIVRRHPFSGEVRLVGSKKFQPLKV